MENRQMSTGLKGLDQVLGGVLAGDNIVFRVDSVQDYLPFVIPYCKNAVKERKPLIYFRFARHAPLVTQGMGAKVVELDPEQGFEPFLNAIHDVIEDTGPGAQYVFDSLSDLVADWYSDQMLANFFVLICPYLFDLETVAYFAMIKHRHSFYATNPIMNTTQLFLDVYRYKGKLYLYPQKVQHRHSPTMYMLHEWQDDSFVPVTQSMLTTEVLSTRPGLKLKLGESLIGTWTQKFVDAQPMAQGPESHLYTREEYEDCFERLLRMAFSRDQRFLKLARKYLTLADVLQISERILGTGLIGGKAVGVVLARAILRKNAPELYDKLERPDSFYIASDVYYTFLVENGCWWLRKSLDDPTTLMKRAREARRHILRGSFPEHRIRQFSDMLDYFGQSPIIVRSSSLLEDNFGNAFAGKYESVFCANQGTHGKRLEDFMSAVRKIYASTLSEKALRYRAERGLLERDEQMSILVQRVSGGMNGNLFYPQAAGVGLSYNPYVWDKMIDPQAGMLRLVFGMGTRAVDRSDEDYIRLVGLNDPTRVPGEFEEGRMRTQRKVDVLDLSANQLVDAEFSDVAALSPTLQLDMFASRDRSIEEFARSRGLKDVFPYVLDFGDLFRQTEFANDMRKMLGSLQAAYNYPVDVEFTLNFVRESTYRVNLVQCRPLQIKGEALQQTLPENIAIENTVLKTVQTVIGPGGVRDIELMIYVEPEAYSACSHQDKYAVARLIGNVMHSSQLTGKQVLLIGPGRWGTTTPSLGVPVAFNEINAVSVLCEVATMHEGFAPEVSLGTHFFNDMVECEILYLALSPNAEGNMLQTSFFDTASNIVQDLVHTVPDHLAEVVRVVNVAEYTEWGGCKLVASPMHQQAICYLER